MMVRLGFTASIDTKKLCELRILRRDPDAEARVTREWGSPDRSGKGQPQFEVFAEGDISARLTAVHTVRAASSWALDSTPVEGRKHFAVGIKPQDEICMDSGCWSAEDREHNNDAVADHSHVWPNARPVVAWVL
jgi:hypothetical protein